MAVKPNCLLMDQIESTVQKLSFIYSVGLGAKYKLSNLVTNPSYPNFNLQCRLPYFMNIFSFAL